MTRNQCLTDEQRGKLDRKFDEIKRRLRDGPLEFQETMRNLQDCVIESELPDIDIFETYTVALLPSQKISIAQLVTDGLYDEFDPRILHSGYCRENNFVRQAEVRTATLIRIYLPASKNRVIQSLMRKGLRPLSAREFLCFGKSNPNILSTGLPIVGVGGAWRLSHDYPEEYLYLEGSQNKRMLKLKPEPENGWLTDHVFIGFPIKIEPPMYSSL